MDHPKMLKPLHFCSAKIIPLVFDNSLSYYEQLCAFSAKLNNIIDYVNSMSLGITEFYQMINDEINNYTTLTEFNEFKNYVLNLIHNIVVSGIGQTIDPGTTYEIGGVTYTAGQGAEILNSYEGATKNKAAGSYSLAIGANTAALATGSHAEGAQTISTGNASHAEGAATTATAQGAHSEGIQTEASGTGSHSEGINSIASGLASHASGSNTTAAGNYQTVIGCYNIPNSEVVTKTDDDDNTYTLPKFPFILGNGYYGSTTQADIKSDAFKVDSDGNIYVGNEQTGHDVSQAVYSPNIRNAYAVTQAEYDALVAAQQIDEYGLYCIIEEVTP